jgi:PAS domain S-box-containing protein
VGTGARAPGAFHISRGHTLAAAVLMFAAVFFLRLSVDGAGHVVTILYAFPIVLVAVELGVAGGLAAAVLALCLFVLWQGLGADEHAAAIDYLTRGGAALLLGGVVGALADRLRALSAESTRFWDLSNELLGTSGFDGYFTRLNPAWERTLGWTTEELRSRPFVEFVHPEDRERTMEETAGLASGSETLHFENRYRCKDGSYRVLSWRATGDVDRRVVYAVARDVTDSKRAEEELRDSERFLESVLENLPGMVFVKDATDLRFVRFNRAGEKLLGRSREELIGKSDHDLFPAGVAASFVEKDRQVLASRDAIDIAEEPIDTVDNGRRILHTRKIGLRDEHGEPRYLLGVSEDITDRKRAEEAADAAHAEADRANAAKSEFLSRMSHELRTPLNSVLGFAELLWMDGVVGDQRDHVERIRRSGRHLLDLINEVLDLSRIEAGHMTVSPEPVHLRAAVVEAMEMIAPEAASRGITLEPDHGPVCDSYVRADQQRLKQVLLNLLSNAVKYNRPGGSVRVSCAHHNGSATPCVTVTDTGPGIPEDQLDRLFSPFDRLGADQGHEEGTGLGLALSKHLVELMDGRLWAESEVGTGTTLWLELAAATAPQLVSGPQAASAATAALPDSPELTLLYIEDNVTNLELIKGALTRLGSPTLLSAVQGRLGIDLAAQHLPDVVLLDLHLPDMHGREVLAQLKSDPRTRHIPVIVLSADATERQVRRLLDAGAYDYLTKPIEIPNFLKTIRRAAAGEEASV